MLLTIDKPNRVKLFTHNDLDGRGCEVVGRLAFRNIDVTIVKNPQDASKKVKEFFEQDNHLWYDKIFITDISVSKEVADFISSKISDNLGLVTLLDHHGTAEYLNEYIWASVSVHGMRGKNSGTNMFFEFLATNGFFRGIVFKDALTVFVEKVRRYDCWEWKEVYGDQESASLNQLFWLIGGDSFVDRYVTRFEKSDLFSIFDGRWREMFDESDKIILNVDNAKKDAYFLKKNKEMFRMRYGKHYVGVVFAEQYISELGNYLSEINEGLKFIALIDMGGKKVSLRTIHNDIDLGKDVAKLFGGGGHAKASGFQFGGWSTVRLVDEIFNNSILAKILKVIDKIKR